MNDSIYLISCLCLVLASGCGLDPNAPSEPTSTSVSTSAGTGAGAESDSTPGPSTDSAGDDDPVGACQDLEDTLSACLPNLAGSLSCTFYDAWPCDLGPYFDCVTDAYGTCEGGTFPNADPLSLQDCAGLTVCG